VAGTDLAAVTNALGRFEIEEVVPGSVVVIVRAAGFLERRSTNLMVPAGGALPLTLELEVAPHDLNRLQVTVSKIPLRIGDVSTQVDIVDRSTIEERGGQHLTQAIAHVPGLVVSTRQRSFESVSLRGLPREADEFTSTLLLIDGVPQTESGNGTQVINLPIIDAQRIEVARGPGAALYGRTALGGAINVQTADPTPAHQAGFDLMGGEFGMLQGAARASGPLASWSGYYVSAARERNTGFYTGPFDFSADQTSVFVKLTLALGSRSFGNVSAHHAVSNQSLPTSIPIIDGRLLGDVDPRFDRRTDLNVEGPNYRRREGRYTANYTWQVADALRLANVFGYRLLEYELINSGEALFSPVDIVTHTLTQIARDVQREEAIIYAESRVELDPTQRLMDLSVVAGGSYEHTSGSIAGNILGVSGWGWPLDYLDPVHPPRGDWESFSSLRSAYELGNAGIFGHVRIAPARHVILSAGGRYDRFDLHKTLKSRASQPIIKDGFDWFSPEVIATIKLLPR
jgi:outer membrane receptor protein involved in Fe transport